MEDGVLIAPAPYAAPAAYYFPTTGRIAGIEVLKGPAAIANGPYTIGGAINLLSTPIPQDEFAGRITQEIGTDNLYRTHGFAGGSSDNFGWLVEGHTHATDGFADIDRASDQTGFDKDDLMVKLRVNSDAAADVYHQLDLKLQYAQEDSDQTYVGLTDRDFKHDSERRYGLTKLDNMRNNFKGTTLGYLVDMGDLRIGTQAYYHEFQRNWYKVDRIGGLSLGNFFNCANFGGNCGAVGSQANAQAILDGNAAGRVDVKGNDRKYQSKGIQTKVNKDLELAGLEHGLEVGLRYHEDQEFRDQYSDRFQQDASGNLSFVSRSREAKRTQRAKAVSYYVTDAIRFGDLTLTPGMRVEDYKVGRRDDNVKDQHDRETLFGLGALYKLSEQWSLLAGVHEGFTPTASVGADAERALNYELGARYNDGRLNGEVVGFYSDYDNLLGLCTASTGADCTVGDQFNGGAVKVRGVESRLGYDLVRGAGFTIPVGLTYTWTDSEFQTSFSQPEFFGSVEKGDALPNLPEHQAVLSVGYRNEQGFATDLRTNWYDSTCSFATCTTYEKIDSYYTVDLATRYALDKQTEVYLNLLNLTDNTDDIIARQPAGARGQMPRSAVVGVSYNF